MNVGSPILADVLLFVGGTGTLLAALVTRAPRGSVTSRWSWVAYGVGCGLFFALLTITSLLDSHDRTMLRTVVMTVAGLAGVAGTVMVVKTELGALGGEPTAVQGTGPVPVWRQGAALLALLGGDALLILSVVAESSVRRASGVAGGLVLIVFAVGLLLMHSGINRTDRQVQS